MKEDESQRITTGIKITAASTANRLPQFLAIVYTHDSYNVLLSAFVDGTILQIQ